MAAITWRNVGIPNFAASNQLAINAGNLLKESITGFGDVLTAEGDRRKDINTDRGVAAASAIQGLENFPQSRADIMGNLGNNVDAATISEAINARQQLLQGNQTYENDLLTFADDRRVNELAIQDAEYNQSPAQRELAQRAEETGIARDNAAIRLRNTQTKEIENAATIVDQNKQYIAQTQAIIGSLQGNTNYTNPETGFLDPKKVLGHPSLKNIPVNFIEAYMKSREAISGAAADRLHRNKVQLEREDADRADIVKSKEYQYETAKEKVTALRSSVNRLSAGKNVPAHIDNYANGIWGIGNEKDTKLLADKFYASVPEEEIIRLIDIYRGDSSTANLRELEIALKDAENIHKSSLATAEKNKAVSSMSEAARLASNDLSKKGDPGLNIPPRPKELTDLEKASIAIQVKNPWDYRKKRGSGQGGRNTKNNSKFLSR